MTTINKESGSKEVDKNKNAHKIEAGKPDAEKGEKTEELRPQADEDKRREPKFTIFWLCAGVLLLWIVCTLGIYFVFADWSTRGTVGDSFGAVNALFSGLAFAGVIYSLNLQRRELTYQREEMLATRAVSEAQLLEMQASRELLSQPLPMPEVAIFHVERSRLFYSPPEDEHSVQSRYRVGINISNPTQYPAIGVNVSCFLQFDNKILGSTDSYVPIVAPGTNIADPRVRPDFLFAGDTSGLLFDSLRQHDPRKVPTLFVSILFKNTVGAHFRIFQAFRIYASDQHAPTLRLWHTGIAGFHAKYKQELTQLKELKRKGREEEWDDLFELIKKEFDEALPGEAKIGLKVEAVPASFSLSHIGREEFEKDMSEAQYSQLINSLYDCPLELDARK